MIVKSEPRWAALLRLASRMVLLFACLAPALARADDSPRAFVEAIYKQYVGEQSKGVAMDTRAQLAKLFTDDLVKAIDQDQRAAAKRGEVGTLEGDPFIDAQDWRIASFEVQLGPGAKGRTLAVVTFQNLDQAKRIELELVREKKGWRIRNVRGGTLDLRKLFKLGE